MRIAKQRSVYADVDTGRVFGSLLELGPDVESSQFYPYGHQGFTAEELRTIANLMDKEDAEAAAKKRSAR